MEKTKQYEYKGKIYFDGVADHAVKNYGGNTFDLYMALKADGKAGVTEPLYFSSDSNTLYYNTAGELIEGEFSDLEAKDEK